MRRGRDIGLIHDGGIGGAAFDGRQREANAAGRHGLRRQIPPDARHLEVLFCIEAGRNRRRVADRNPLDRRVEEVARRFHRAGPIVGDRNRQLIREQIDAAGRVDAHGHGVHLRFVRADEHVRPGAEGNLPRERVRGAEVQQHALPRLRLVDRRQLLQHVREADGRRDDHGTVRALGTGVERDRKERHRRQEPPDHAACHNLVNLV